MFYNPSAGGSRRARTFRPQLLTIVPIEHTATLPLSNYRHHPLTSVVQQRTHAITIVMFASFL